MNTQAERRLSTLPAEIARHAAGVSILREHLEQRRSVAMDLWARALASETPYADREFDLADRACRRVEGRLRDEERRLASLVEERSSLMRLVQGSGDAEAW